MTTLTLVVAGFPNLARALEASGQFAQVLTTENTSGVPTLIRDQVGNKSAAEVAFLFGDTLATDSGTPLEVLVQKLTSASYRVGVLALSPRAEQLVNANPGAGLIPGPFTVNRVIGALRGLGFMLEPVAVGGDETIDSTVNGLPGLAGVAPAGGGWDSAPAAPAAGGWDSAPAAPAAGGWDSAPAAHAPAAGGWDSAPAAPAPAAGGWDSAPAAPAGGGWDSAPAAPAPAAGGWDSAAAAPAAPAGGGWDSAPAAPAGGGWDSAPAAPAAPAGGGWDSAPAAPAGGSWDNQAAYGQPAPAGGARPVVRPRGFVVTIASPKGGTGKSTLSLNLAAYMGLRLRGTGKTVCIIDTNFQQADTGKYLNQYTPNIIDVVSNPGSISVERLNNYLVHTRYNLSALLGPARVVDADTNFINAYLYKQVLEVLTELYDYIFIDTPVAEFYHATFSEFALPSANFIIVPVAPSLTTLTNVDNWLRQITSPKHTGGNGVDRSKVGVVLNRAQENIDCSPETVRENLANWTFIGMIPETAEWKRAENNFEIVATKNYHELTDAFTRILYAATGEETLKSGPVQQAATGKQKSGKVGFLEKLKRRKG